MGKQRFQSVFYIIGIYKKSFKKISTKIFQKDLKPNNSAVQMKIGTLWCILMIIFASGLYLDNVVLGLRSDPNLV